MNEVQWSTERFIRNTECQVPTEYRKKAKLAAAEVAARFGTERQQEEKVSWLASVLTKNAPETNELGKLFALFEPEDEVRSEIIADWVKPWADQLRTELFMTAEPPFKSIEEAVAWIKKEEENTHPPPDWINDLVDFERRVIAEVRDMQNRGMPLDVGIDFPVPTLPYPGKGKWQEVAQAIHSPKLRKLAQETEKMGEAIGWKQHQAVMFVLTGGIPVVSRVDLRICTASAKGEHGQGTLVRRWAECQIRGKNVSLKDLRRLFKILRQEGVAKKKPLREKDVRVYRFVRSSRQQRLRWEEIRQRWNATYPNDKFASVRGMQKGYRKAFLKESEIQ